MFKTTSASQQSRTRRAVVEATRNETKADFERTEMDINSRHSVLVIEKRQVEEELARLNPDAGMVVCDRGTVDGLAYWPGKPESFFKSAGTTLEEELKRYTAIVHVTTPGISAQYRKNNIRHESLRQARVIDRKISALWAPHPHHHEVNSATDFIDKATAAIAILRDHLPGCCK